LLHNNQTVDIFLTNRSVPTIDDLELPIALLGAFVAGAVVWFFVSLFQVIAAKSEVASLKRRNRELNRELTELRNMPVRDLDPEAFAAESDDIGES
jgi:hypothetical protein